MATPYVYEPKNLHGDYLASTNTMIYTAPSLKRAIVKEIVLHNPTAGAVYARLQRVPSGGTAGTRYQFFGQLIVAGDTVVVGLSMTLETGDFLSGYADAASSITAIISGQVSQT